MSSGKVSLIESLYDEITTKMSQVLPSTRSAVNISAKIYAAQVMGNLPCSSDEQRAKLMQKLQNSAEVKESRTQKVRILPDWTQLRASASGRSFTRRSVLWSTFTLQLLHNWPGRALGKSNFSCPFIAFAGFNSKRRSPKNSCSLLCFD